MSPTDILRMKFIRDIIKIKCRVWYFLISIEPIPGLILIIFIKKIIIEEYPITHLDECGCGRMKVTCGHKLSMPLANIEVDGTKPNSIGYFLKL